MKILIVEDEALYADQLEMLCNQLGYEVTDICEDAFSALASFYASPPDLLLSDVNLIGDVDGIRLAEQLNTQRKVPTIFITSLQDDATFQRAQAILPAAFIVKPFSSLQLQRSIELAVSQLDREASHDFNFEENDLQLADSFFVKVKSRLEKVRLQEVTYLAADGRYSMIHTLNGRKFAVRIPLSKLEAKLPAHQFLRSHRSYICNLDFLLSVDIGEMVLKLMTNEVPISKGYKEIVLARINQLE